VVLIEFQLMPSLRGANISLNGGLLPWNWKANQQPKAVRGGDKRTGELFSYVDLEARGLRSLGSC
jgi:hypothetical protein